MIADLVFDGMRLFDNLRNAAHTILSLILNIITFQLYPQKSNPPLPVQKYLTNELPSREITTAAIITGCSSGIGKAVAIKLASVGYKVFAGVRKASDVDSLNNLKISNLRPILLDVTKDSDVQNSLKILRSWIDDEESSPLKRRRLGILINNAGIPYVSSLENSTIPTSLAVFDVNFFGALRMMKEFMCLLECGSERNLMSSRIINVSSLSGAIWNVSSLSGAIWNAPLHGVYAGSKAALESITDAARIELVDKGISVISIQPGAIDTPIWNKAQNIANELAGDKSGKFVKNYAVEGHKGTVSTITVVDVIMHAIQSPFPKEKYVIGTDAQALGFFNAVLLFGSWIPFPHILNPFVFIRRVVDRIVYKMMTK
ncbi:hypothetical protein HK098_007979 [Nowakowskiella sp. JEL0407]|nr:hypothetical protein HK098_007979 [Nowakowskiella sp. JEL0407]